jgi:hypothetical protein
MKQSWVLARVNDLNGEALSTIACGYNSRLIFVLVRLAIARYFVQDSTQSAEKVVRLRTVRVSIYSRQRLILPF